jgi:hypothetical protein
MVMRRSLKAVGYSGSGSFAPSSLPLLSSSLVASFSVSLFGIDSLFESSLAVVISLLVSSAAVEFRIGSSTRVLSFSLDGLEDLSRDSTSVSDDNAL